MYPPNLKSVALPVPEIRGGSLVANPQCRERGGHRGSGMVPFERALSSSYKSSIHIISLYQHSFARNFRLQFWVGVASPNFGEGEAVGGHGTVRKSVSMFL